MTHRALRELGKIEDCVLGPWGPAFAADEAVRAINCVLRIIEGPELMSLPEKSRGNKAEISPHATAIAEIEHESASSEISPAPAAGPGSRIGASSAYSARHRLFSYHGDGKLSP